MESVTKMFIRARESLARQFQGQTMVEYALSIASIGVVAWGAYNLTGHDIGSDVERHRFESDQRVTTI